MNEYETRYVQDDNIVVKLAYSGACSLSCKIKYGLGSLSMLLKIAQQG